jgi:hypothetical protein
MHPAQQRRCLIGGEVALGAAGDEVAQQRVQAVHLCVSQPVGGKKHPSQPTSALGTLGAADPAA